MSKFWATTQSSDSESDSDRDSDYETKNKAKMGGRYDMFDESSGKIEFISFSYFYLY